jgi:hypothetical protein
MQRVCSIIGGLLLACSVSGCELVADFDRGKIASGMLDSSVPPSNGNVEDDDGGSEDSDAGPKK